MSLYDEYKKYKEGRNNPSLSSNNSIYEKYLAYKNGTTTAPEPVAEPEKKDFKADYLANVDDSGTTSNYADILKSADYASLSQYQGDTTKDYSGIKGRWESITDIFRPAQDKQYEAINGVSNDYGNGLFDAFSKAMDSLGKQVGADDVPYLSMTETEKGIYNYLHNTGDTEGAAKYYKEIEPALLERAKNMQAQEEYEKASEGGYGRVLGTSIANLPKSVLNGVNSAIVGTMAGISSEIAGDGFQEGWTDFANRNALGSQVRAERAANAAKIAEDTSTFGQDVEGKSKIRTGIEKGLNAMFDTENLPGALYNTGMSAAENLVGLALTKGLTNTAGALGISSKTAQKIGEAIYLTSMGGNAAEQKTLDILQRGGTEEEAALSGITSGLIEVATEHLGFDTAFDIITGKSITSAGAVAKSLASMFGSEALEESTSDVLNRIADYFVLDKNGKGAKSEWQEYYEARLAEGNDAKTAENLTLQAFWRNATADALFGGLSGIALGGASVGANVIENRSTGKAINRAQNVDKLREQAIEAGRNDLAETLEKNPSKAQIGFVQNELLNDAYDRATKEGATTEDALNYLKTAQAAETNKLSKTGIADKKGNPLHIKNINWDGDNPVFETEEGFFKAPDVVVSDSAAGLINLSENVDKAARKAFIENYKGGNLGDYTDAFNVAYEYGKRGLTDSLQELVKEGSLTFEQARNIYAAGLMDKESVTSKLTEAQKRIDQRRKMFPNRKIRAKIDDSAVDYSTITDNQRKNLHFIEAVAKAFGVNVKVFDSEKTPELKDKNGAFDDNNTIFLDINASNTGAHGDKTNAITTTMSHDLTHWAKKNAPELYKAFRAEVLRALAEEYGSLITEKTGTDTKVNIADYVKLMQNEKYKGLSEEAVEDELIARACENMLSNSQYAQKALANMTKEEQKTFGDKVAELFKKIIEAIKEIMGRYDSKSAEYQLLARDAETLEGLQRSWDNMIKAAAENVAYTVEDEAFYSDNAGTAGVQFSQKVTDAETLDFLNNQETIKTYRSMQLIDGKLYPPMAAKIKGGFEDASQIGQWEQAVEHPELVNKDGKFVLDKRLQTMYGKRIEKNPANMVNASNDADTITPVTIVGTDSDYRIAANKEKVNEKTIKSKKPFSIKDSEGNILTDNQAKFFEKSKIRDKDGNLLLVYHGTPTGGFTVFRNGLTYFTANRDYAKRYTRVAGTGRNGNTPQVYEGYINIKKPFSLDDKKAKDIYINEYIKGGYAQGMNPYASDAEIEKYAANGIDWNEADNLYEFLDENGYDYDGFILNEGGDLTEQGTVSRGPSYVTFKPNQFKRADNLNPTNNVDMNFSMKREVEDITEDQYAEMKKHFGTTKNFNFPGYMLKDGTMLDFSGKHWGNPRPESREVDHREIAEVLGTDYNGTDAMVNMIGNGNIRLMPEVGGICLSKMPTDDQFKALYDYVYYHLHHGDREITVDFDEPGGDTVASRFYDNDVTPGEVLRDIEAYFKGARKSDLMQFYSDKSDDERIFYTHGTEVIQNPTDTEYMQMREEILNDYPWLRGTGEILLRHTYDEDGNVYYWDASKGMHRQIEPEINKRYNTRTSQHWEWWKQPDKNDYLLAYSRKDDEGNLHLDFDTEEFEQYAKVERDVKRLSKEWRDKYGVQESAAEISRMLKAVIESDKAGYEKAVDELTRTLVKNARSVEPGIKAEADRVKKELKKYKFSMNDKQKAEMKSAYGANWSQKIFGKLSYRKDGIPLDDLWSTLVSEYPTFFHEETDANEPVALVEAIDELYSGKYAGVEWGSEDKKEIAKEIKADIKAVYGVARSLYDDAQAPVDMETLEKKYGEAIRELHQRIAAAKREVREDAQRQRLIAKIVERENKLATMFRKNDKESHIPDILKEPLKQIFESVNIESRVSPGTMANNFTALAKALEDVTTQPEALEGLEMYFDSEGYFIQNVRDIAAELQAKIGDITNNARKGVSINDLSAESLKKLNEALAAITAAARKYDRVLAEDTNQRISERAESSMQFVGSIAPRKATNKLVKQVVTFLGWDNVTPVYGYDRFGDGGKQTFKGIMAGDDQLTRNSKVIIDFAKNTFTGQEAEDWNNEIQSVTVAGKEYFMTTAQIMSLYCLNKRESAKQHLYLHENVYGEEIQGDGIIIGENKETEKTGVIHVTESDIKAVTDLLTDRQKEVADKLQEFLSTVCSDWGNYVTMRRFGIMQFGEKNYFPMNVNPNNRASLPQETMQQASIFKLLNMGFTKSLNERGNGALIISSIFDVFTKHASEMAAYNAMALPILDAYKWLSYKVRNGREVASFKNEIERVYGSDGLNFVLDHLADLNGTSKRATSAEQFVKSVIRRYKTAATAANLRVVLMQPTSYLRALNEIDGKYLRRAITINPKELKATIAEMNEKSALAMKKNGLDAFDLNVSRTIEEQAMQSENIKGVKGAIQKAMDASMWLAGKADEITWGTLYKAVQLEISEKTDLKGEAFDKAVNDRFEDICYRTQVFDDINARSNLMRKKDIAHQVLTAFGSEPTLSYSMLSNNVFMYAVEARNNRAAAWHKYAPKIKRAFVSYLMSAIAVSAVAAVPDWLRDDDDEEGFIQKYFKNLGMNILGEATGLLPYIRDIASIFQGYDPSRPDEEIIKTARQFVNHVLKADGNISYRTVYSAAKLFSQATGVPVANVVRDIKSLWNKTIGEIFGMKIE